MDRSPSLWHFAHPSVVAVLIGSRSGSSSSPHSLNWDSCPRRAAQWSGCWSLSLTPLMYCRRLTPQVTASVPREVSEGSFRHSGALGGVGGRIPSLQLTFPPIQENLERRVRRVEINRCYRDLLLKLFPSRSSLPFSLVTQLKHCCLPTSHANPGSPTPWFSRAHFPALA